jgi:nicotinamide-nucleotide amidase
MPAVTVRIIAVGDELLEGRTSDTNSTRIQRALGRHAVTVADILVIPDRIAAIGAALARTSPGDIVFLCGGLGSTSDDVTREGLAAWADTPLQHREDLAAALSRRRCQRGLPPLVEGDKQALVPAGCETVANPVGTAPGLVGVFKGRRLAVLPGVPHELQALLPGVLDRLGALGALPPPLPVSLRRTAQIAELAAARLCEPVRERFAELDWSWWLVPWGVDIRLRGQAGQEALVTAAACELDRLLADAIYAREMIDLPQVVQDLMLARGETLAVAESCTGGRLGAAITAQPGSSGYYLGGVLSYADEVKRDLLLVEAATLAAHGAVSRPVAEQMARGARQRLGSDHALAVTGIAGPDGGTPDKPVGTTWIAIAGATGVEAACYRFSGDRERNLRLAVAAALDTLRRSLLGVPLFVPARQSWLRVT